VAIERRPLAGGAYAVVSSSLERAGFLAAFTERTGGVSPAPFDSLNLSLSTDDDPANGRENRARVVSALRIPPFASAYQVHGSGAVRVGAERAGAGFDDPEARLPPADILYTKRRGVPLAVLTADCLPVVLAAPDEGTVAVVHAGWRGLAAGILASAVSLFEEPAALLAAVGPSVGPCHYEVGEAVAREVDFGSGGRAVTGRGGSSLSLDLAGTACATLKTLGVDRVEVSGLCTACEGDRFYSYRRDGATGRQAAVAMRL
jgi:YfiH family protein